MVKHVAVPYVPVTVKIVPNVNRLAAAVCRTGDKVFWLKHTSMSKLRTLGTTTSAC